MTIFLLHQTMYKSIIIYYYIKHKTVSRLWKIYNITTSFLDKWWKRYNIMASIFQETSENREYYKFHCSYTLGGPCVNCAEHDSLWWSGAFPQKRKLGAVFLCWKCAQLAKFVRQEYIAINDFPFEQEDISALPPWQ